jgi:hypothetical protein
MVIRAAVCLLAVAIFMVPANAESVALTIEKFGLMGSWADDCGKGAIRTSQGFRLVVAEPPGDRPIYTTINVDNSVRTTVRSLILTAAPLPPRQLRLTMRIFGGDRDGGPLPSPTTNTFDQTFEKLASNVMQMAGNPPITLNRCSD